MPGQSGTAPGLGAGRAAAAPVSEGLTKQGAGIPKLGAGAKGPSPSLVRVEGRRDVERRDGGECRWVGSLVGSVSPTEG